MYVIRMRIIVLVVIRNKYCLRDSPNYPRDLNLNLALKAGALTTSLARGLVILLVKSRVLIIQLSVGWVVGCRPFGNSILSRLTMIIYRPKGVPSESPPQVLTYKTDCNGPGIWLTDIERVCIN